MSESVFQGAGAEIFKALSSASQTAFAGIVDDIEKHVLPTMAMIAQSLVTIGSQLASGDIDKEVADIEVEMQVRAAAAVIVGFANTTLLNVQNIINAVLDAVKDTVNTVLGNITLL
jgi:hypothetical protein